MDAITGFVDRLTNAKVAGSVLNPYAGDTLEAAVCRANLTHYLRLMDRQQPAVLFVGEAPGYRGCGRTGIPFTSEAIVVDHETFGIANGFQCPPDGAEPRREATATIVWRTLDALALRPLLWNAFPFHPHQPGNTASNRTPTAAEIQVGRPFVANLLVMFPIEFVVAVGNKAASALRRWAIAATPVRHPAHGGGGQFRRELRDWYGDGNRGPTALAKFDAIT